MIKITQEIKRTQEIHLTVPKCVVPTDLQYGDCIHAALEASGTCYGHKCLTCFFHAENFNKFVAENKTEEV